MHTRRRRAAPRQSDPRRARARTSNNPCTNECNAGWRASAQKRPPPPARASHGTRKHVFAYRTYALLTEAPSSASCAHGDYPHRHTSTHKKCVDRANGFQTCTRRISPHSSPPDSENRAHLAHHRVTMTGARRVHMSPLEQALPAAAVGRFSRYHGILYSSSSSSAVRIWGLRMCRLQTAPPHPPSGAHRLPPSALPHCTP